MERELKTTLNSPLQQFPVLRQAVDNFASQGRHRASEVVVFAELAERYLADANLADRRYVSALLATRADAPRRIVMRLAIDEPTVAAPVLSRSPQLRPKDLSDIITNQGADHRLAIAARTDLTSELVELLFEFDDERLIDRLLANPRAPIPLTRKNAMIVEASQTPDRAQTLAERQDTDAVSLARLFVHLTQDGRRRALMVCEARAALEAVLPGALSRPQQHAVGVGQHLEELALKADMTSFRAVLGDCAGLSEQTVDELINDQSGEPLALVLCSLGMTEASAITIFLFATPTIGNDYRAMQEIRRFYSDLSWRTAEFVVDTWRSAPSQKDIQDTTIGGDIVGELRTELGTVTPSAHSTDVQRRSTPLADRRMETTVGADAPSTARPKVISLFKKRRR